MRGPAIIVAGPTASGKSALALSVAEAFGGVIINGDSMQLYRELAILTARPGAEAMRRIPHRLYGVLPAAEACSVGRWRGLARAEIDSARRSERMPIVVGGTGLYLKALVEGLSDIPEIPPEIRGAARARLARIGGPAFHAELRRRDPEAAARLRPSDRQRLVRAWEVIEATGRSLVDWQSAAPVGRPTDHRFLTLVLLPPREILYTACDARFWAMIEHGAVAEVARLLALELAPDLPAMRAIGVRELAAHLRGELTLGEAVKRAQRATRQYVKRQTTWLRHQMAAERLIHAQYSESLDQEIFSFIRQNLLTADG